MTHHRPSKKTHASAPHARSAAPKRIQNTSDSKGRLAPALLGTAAALGAAALYTAKKTRDAERKHPPIGRFLDVDGVRLHYIERGNGEPLVLIHGNGTLIQDFTINGLVDRLSERYRVIVIERPGYGYSERPRQLWTPRAHATLFEHALAQLGVEQAIVLGHSWGTMVAVSLALQAPDPRAQPRPALGLLLPDRPDGRGPELAPCRSGDRGRAAPHDLAAARSAHAAGRHPRDVRARARAGAFRPALPEGVDGAPDPASCVSGGCGADDARP